MGLRDQLGKRIFREESPKVTAGALEWEDPPEIAIHEARPDGLLMLKDPVKAASLPPPWRLAKGDEIMVELKMQGDHLDRGAFHRALLRR